MEEQLLKPVEKFCQNRRAPVKSHSARGSCFPIINILSEVTSHPNTTTICTATKYASPFIASFRQDFMHCQLECAALPMPLEGESPSSRCPCARSQPPPTTTAPKYAVLTTPGPHRSGPRWCGEGLATVVDGVMRDYPP